MSFSVASNDFIQVGIIVNTQGIKGELKIKPFTFDYDRFGMDVEYFVEGYENSFRIERYRINKNMVVMKFREYDDINDVEKFKGHKLYIKEKDILPLKEDNYYIYQLKGFQVFDISDKGSGILKNVVLGNGNDLFEIETHEGKIYYLPVVKSFVKKVDLLSKKITIETIEGMI